MNPDREWIKAMAEKEDGQYVGAGADEEEECACLQIDVDLVDARGCPVHGPHSPLAHRLRKQEAADEAAYWAGWKPESGS